MDLLYAGIFDNISLQTLAEVVRDPPAKDAAIREVATYTQTGLETRKVGGLHFSFALVEGPGSAGSSEATIVNVDLGASATSASSSSSRALIICLVSKGHSLRLVQQLIEAITKTACGASTTPDARKAGLEAVVSRYAGDRNLLLSPEAGAGGEDRLDGLADHLGKLKQAAQSNVEAVFDRRGKLDSLVTRSEGLASETTAIFRRSAKTLKEARTWQQRQGWFIVGGGACFMTLVLWFAVRA